MRAIKIDSDWRTDNRRRMSQCAAAKRESSTMCDALAPSSRVHWEQMQPEKWAQWM